MELTVTHHRCDASTLIAMENEKAQSVSCGAAAYVQVANMNEQDLLFCRHHYAKFELNLIEQGFQVISDKRAMIENINKLVGSDH